METSADGELTWIGVEQMHFSGTEQDSVPREMQVHFAVYATRKQRTCPDRVSGKIKYQSLTRIRMNLMSV